MKRTKQCWSDMKQRCLNAAHPQFKITVDGASESVMSGNSPMPAALQAEQPEGS